LITDNAQEFKSASMVEFCERYNINLAHSTPYYPKGKMLAKSSNESLIRIIKKLLVENKRGWNSKLKYGLWVDKNSTKKSIGTSPFQLVYGIDVVFLIQLGFSMMKVLQDELEEPNDVQRRIFQLIEMQQNMNILNEKSQTYQNKVKAIFVKKNKEDSFQPWDLFLKWDARIKDKSRHGKFDNIWFDPFRVARDLNKNTFILYNLDDDELVGGLVNGHFLNHFLVYQVNNGFENGHIGFQIGVI
jgi:hypothetical protein